MATLQKIEAANHTPEQVREIVAEAWKIASELTENEHERHLIFVRACELLGQKSVSFIAEQGLPAMAIPRNHGR